MDMVGLDIVEQPLVMGDHDDSTIRRALRVDALRDNSQRVDIKTAIGLVQQRELRLQHRHLENLVALLLAAREADIDAALKQILADLQLFQLGADGFEELAGIEFRLAAITARRIEGGAEEIHIVHARYLDRILESEKDAFARPLIGGEREQILAFDR